MPDHNYFANLIWQIADLLRGPYRPPQYERVMLPITVLRRFDCVLAPTKAKVVSEYERAKDKYKGDALDARLNKASGQRFHRGPKNAREGIAATNARSLRKVRSRTPALPLYRSTPALTLVLRAKDGLLGRITNHSYTTARLSRGMRLS